MINYKASNNVQITFLRGKKAQQKTKEGRKLATGGWVEMARLHINLILALTKEP